MHPFYRLPRPILWTVSVLLALSALAPFAVLAWLGARLLEGLGPAGLLLLPVAYAVLLPLSLPWIQLATAPLMRLAGYYRYYSPMLLVENPRPTGYHVHGGSNFDYLLHLRWRDRGAEAARKTLLFYLRGLLALSEEARRGALPPELPIVASSYVFSEATARRLGFAVEPIGESERLGLWLNWVNLFLKHSFARGRPALPDLSRAKRAVTTAGALAGKEEALRRLLARVERAGG